MNKTTSIIKHEEAVEGEIVSNYGKFSVQDMAEIRRKMAGQRILMQDAKDHIAIHNQLTSMNEKCYYCDSSGTYIYQPFEHD